MYQINTSTNITGYAESVDYCYKLSSGSAQIIGPKERARGAVATGLIFNGTIYNLPGHDDFEGAPTATATKIDAGNALNAQAQLLDRYESEKDDLDSMCVDQELRLSLIEAGVN